MGGQTAVTRANALHGPAHAVGFPPVDAAPPVLVDALHDVERSLGRTRPTRASTPKRPWTAPYMRAVGVSGMLAPLFLETYLNPDLTGPERPYVLAHEWAHLSGYAPEEDASFVGLQQWQPLIGVGLSRYSGLLGVGLDAKLSARTALKFSYDYEMGQRDQAQMLSARFSLAF